VTRQELDADGGLLRALSGHRAATTSAGAAGRGSTATGAHQGERAGQRR
jgi:hypothetical protein